MPQSGFKPSRPKASAATEWTSDLVRGVFGIRRLFLFATGRWPVSERGGLV